MKTALDIAIIVFMLTASVGVVLLGRFLYVVLFRPHPIPSNPWPPELRSVSTEAALHALERTRLNFFQALGKEKERLGYEVRRLEGRIAQLQLRVRDEQASYRHLGLQRIEAWKQWRTLRDELTGARKHEQHDTRRLVLEAEKKYRDLDAKLLAAHQRYDARDRLLLEELNAQGVLKTEAELTQGAAGHTIHHEAQEPGTGTPHAESAQPDAQDAAPAAHEQGILEQPAATGQPGQDGADAEHAAPGDQPGGQWPAAAPGQDTDAEHAAPGAKAFSEFDLHRGDFADPQVSKQFKRYRDPTFDLGWAPEGLMSNVDLAGSSFTGVRFLGLHRYRHCNFQRATLRGVVLLRHERPHQFAHCNFRDADFSGSRLAYMVFSSCDLSRSRWQGAQLDLVKFVDCNVEGIDWNGVDLHRTVMSDDMLSACDFSGASHPPKNYVPPEAASPPAARQPEAGDGRQRGPTTGGTAAMKARVAPRADAAASAAMPVSRGGPPASSARSAAPAAPRAAPASHPKPAPAALSQTGTTPASEPPES